MNDWTFRLCCTAGVLAIIALYWAFWGVQFGPQAPAVTALRVERDTIVREVPAAPIIIREASVKVVTTRDTVRVPWIDTTNPAAPDTLGAMRPFTASLDTVIGRDTVQTEFSFPPPRQSVVLRPGPDSVITHTITVTITREPSIFEKIGWGAVGAAAGAGITLILGR